MIDVQEGLNQHHLFLRDRIVMSAPCRCMCEHAARKLHRARESSQREAMHILTEELGMCEGVAKQVYHLFFEEVSRSMQ